MKKIVIIVSIFFVSGFLISSLYGNSNSYKSDYAVPSQASAGYVPNNAIMQQQQKEKQNKQKFTYSDLLLSIENKQIKEANLFSKQGKVDVILNDNKKYSVEFPTDDNETLSHKLSDSGAKVIVSNSDKKTFFGFLGNVLTFLIIGLAIFIFFRMIKGNSGGSFGGQANYNKIKGAETANNNVSTVRFKDVAGVEEVVDSLQDVLQFMKHPEDFKKLGAKMPKGMIFHGPPGTGKTLLAKALAGEAGVPFYSVSGSDFVEMFVGRGAARMRELFAQARENSPCVIFFDELDALGKKRSQSSMNGNDEREQTLNQMLVEMDGFKDNDRIFCIGATNRLDTLDPALLRPGRFGSQLLVDLPSEEGRRAILAVHAKDKKLADDVDLDRLAHLTYGSSGADLADMLNQAAILAGREKASCITQAHLEEGYMESLAGPRKKSAIMADGEIEVVAVHEAGHVLCAELCKHIEKAHKVSIEQRGKTGGMAVYGRTDRLLQNQQYLHEKLIAALGGRAAEFITNGHITSGAASDLQYANAIARQAVEELGFSSKNGQMITSQSGEQMRVSEKTSALVDEEVRLLVENAYQGAVRMLTTHKKELFALRDALLASENLDRPEIVACLEGLVEQDDSKPTFVKPPVLEKVSDAQEVNVASWRKKLAESLLKERKVPALAKPRRRLRKPVLSPSFQMKKKNLG